MAKPPRIQKRRNARGQFSTLDIPPQASPVPSAPPPGGVSAVAPLATFHCCGSRGGLCGSALVDSILDNIATFPGTDGLLFIDDASDYFQSLGIIDEAGVERMSYDFIESVEECTQAEAEFDADDVAFLCCSRSTMRLYLDRLLRAHLTHWITRLPESHRMHEPTLPVKVRAADGSLVDDGDIAVGR